VVDGKKYKSWPRRDPTKLPWKDLGADIVIEGTGIFPAGRDGDAHRRRCEESAPDRARPGRDDATVVIGVNDNILTGTEVFFSNASCTTNCLARW